MLSGCIAQSRPLQTCVIEKIVPFDSSVEGIVRNTSIYSDVYYNKFKQEERRKIELEEQLRKEEKKK